VEEASVDSDKWDLERLAKRSHHSGAGRKSKPQVGAREISGVIWMLRG
jgi:hypothetical protein